MPIPSEQLPWAARLCPYLATDEGWRSPKPAREHRCTAVDPPARLAVPKQRRLCLTVDHLACATFVAATESRPDRRAAGAEVPLRPVVRTAPVVLEPAPPRLRRALGWSRRGGQAGLALLMVVAVVAIVISRSGEARPGTAGVAGAVVSPSPAVAGATPTPSATAPLSPSPVPATASPSAGPSPSPPPDSFEPGASAGPSSSALPSPTQTYTVRSGDTLSAIAARFGTTVRIIQQLNGIADASLIRVGQVLVLP